MKWKDVKKQIDEYERQSQVIGEQLVPIHRAEAALKNAHRRLWKLDDRCFARFNPGFINDWEPLGLTLADDHGGAPRLTRAALRRAMDVVLHIESWLAGRVDELKPDGPWDKDVPEDKR